MFREDSTQHLIRTEMERKVEQDVVKLYGDLVSLNMIHDGGIIFGDRRLKKNVKLEKQLKLYLDRSE